MFNFIKKLFKKKPQKSTKETTYINLCKKFKTTGIPVLISFDNPQKTITNLHFGRVDFYTEEHLLDLRICRYYEGKIQRLYGTTGQATNAFMSVLYIDLIESDKIFSKTYKEAFREKLTIDKFEKIFLFNANNLAKTLRFEPKITPQQAWEKILEYRKTLN